jgi:hypothetical protein
MAVDSVRAVPELPAGWLPDDALVLAFGGQQEEGLYEVVLPEYTIVGRGETFQAAISEAVELLEDYFQLCAAEGLLFADARRPISGAWYGRLAARTLIGSLARRVQRRGSRRPRVFRFPVGHAHC